MRLAATLIHRWAGLAIALFLVVSGLTGAVISWDHEIDEWLNSDLYTVDSQGEFRSPIELAAVIERHDPRAQVVYIPLHIEAGHSVGYLVQPRIDAHTGKPQPLDYTHVFIDPVTAQIVGTRDASKASFSPRNLMPFLRNLHESLHLPAAWGSDRWGYQLMGIVALIWLLDSFVALYLTLPKRRAQAATRARTGMHTGATTPAGPGPGRSWLQRWKPSWLVRWRAGGYKLHFDLHRAAGLWIWIVILIIAFTSFSLNLYREVFYPAMSMVSQVTPGPFETRPIAPPDQPIEPRIDFDTALHNALAEAQKQNWDRPAGGIFYARNMGFYSIAFFHPGADHGSGGMEIANLYIDGQDGRYLGDYLPWRGTAADIFVQLQFPLHSGRILGFTGRVLMSLMGLVVAMLSITGIVIWARKRRARLHAAWRDKTARA
ncbi:PepSY domain-containing protein [Parapusillimonas sp. SGNA-6]|nr:PepSY domain-containing protein [Parapusillimonas sp. SGNA-6]